VTDPLGEEYPRQVALHDLPEQASRSIVQGSLKVMRIMARKGGAPVSLDTKKSGHMCTSRKSPRTERVTPSKKIDQERE
jgi:hypothetical protein